MKKLILLIVLLNTGLLFSQKVENVTFTQRTDGSLKVDINYDLTASEPAVITVKASADGGATWNLPITSLEGDFGSGVAEGTGKAIVWDFHADNPDQSGADYRVKVTPAIRGTMTGNDGTVYQTIKIGNQWWMAENLRETQYRTGEGEEKNIPVVTDNTGWAGLTSGARCAYNNNETTANTYGYLYNWYAVSDARNIAPDGWCVPTDEDWDILVDYLIDNGYNWDGSTTGNLIGKAMASSGGGWTSSSSAGQVGNDQSSNNASGFSALPAGFRSSSGPFLNLGHHAFFWSATEHDANRAWRRTLGYDRSDVARSHLSKQIGFSVRLVRD